MNFFRLTNRVDTIERFPPVEEKLLGDESEPGRELNVRVDPGLLMNPLAQFVLGEELDRFHFVRVRSQLEIAAHKHDVIDLVLAEHAVVWHVVGSVVNSRDYVELALG